MREAEACELVAESAEPGLAAATGTTASASKPSVSPRVRKGRRDSSRRTCQSACIRCGVHCAWNACIAWIAAPVALFESSSCFSNIGLCCGVICVCPPFWPGVGTRPVWTAVWSMTVFCCIARSCESCAK